jgi:hypothetical protein
MRLAGPHIEQVAWIGRRIGQALAESRPMIDQMHTTADRQTVQQMHRQQGSAEAAADDPEGYLLFPHGPHFNRHPAGFAILHRIGRDIGRPNTSPEKRWYSPSLAQKNGRPAP